MTNAEQWNELLTRLTAEGRKTATRRRVSTTLKVGEELVTSYTTRVPAFLMPVAKCPVICRVTSVRSDYLGDMTDADAKAEGVDSLVEFRDLWQSLGKDRTWNDEQFVEAIEFELVSVNSELLEAM